MVVRYKTIYADPPWNETGGGATYRRGADRHYELMKTDDIIALRFMIRKLIHPDGCHLYLWVTNNFLEDGLLVMKEWGFKYITKITWFKEGKPGLGQYYRGLTEDCLFGVRDVLPYKTKDGKRQQGVTAIYSPRGRHSEKPIKFYEMIEDVSHGPFIELFARSDREGWDCWGDEAPTVTDEYIPPEMINEEKIW